jgi:hypothetical protein
MARLLPQLGFGNHRIQRHVPWIGWETRSLLQREEDAAPKTPPLRSGQQTVVKTSPSPEALAATVPAQPGNQCCVHGADGALGVNGRVRLPDTPPPNFELPWVLYLVQCHASAG